MKVLLAVICTALFLLVIVGEAEHSVNKDKDTIKVGVDNSTIISSDDIKKAMPEFTTPDLTVSPTPEDKPTCPLADIGVKDSDGKWFCTPSPFLPPAADSCMGDGASDECKHATLQI